MRISTSNRPLNGREQIEMVKYLVVLNDSTCDFSTSDELTVEVAIKKIRCEQARRLARITDGRFQRKLLCDVALGVFVCFQKEFQARAAKCHAKGDKTTFTHMFGRLFGIYRDEYISARQQFAKKRGRRWLTATATERDRTRAAAQRKSVEKKRSSS